MFQGGEKNVSNLEDEGLLKEEGKESRNDTIFKSWDIFILNNINKVG